MSKSQEPFESKILPLYANQPNLLETLPQLYLSRISDGDFREALKALLGDKAVLSPSSVASLPPEGTGWISQREVSTPGGGGWYSWAIAGGKRGISWDLLEVYNGATQKEANEGFSGLPGSIGGIRHWRHIN